MKKLFLLVLSAILGVVFSLPAFGWVFSLPGSYESRCGYFGSTTSPLQSLAPRRNDRPGNDVSLLFGPPGLGARVSQGNDLPGTTNARVCGFNYRRGFGVNSGSATFSGSKLKLRPVVRKSNLFEVSGVFSIRSRGTDFNYSWGAAIPASAFPGIPPFDRHYCARPDVASTDTGPLATWEQFWFTITPSESTKVWVGTRDLPFGLGATLANQGSRDIAALGIFPDNWRIVLGTGAVAPQDRFNQDMARPVPYGPPMLFAYTATYTAVTSLYTAEAAAIMYLCCPAKPEKKDDPKDSERWKNKRDDERCVFARLFDDLIFKLPWERNVTVRDGKEEPAGLPFTIFDLGYDYSARLGNRKPFHFITVETTLPNASMGLGLFSYSHLKEISSIAAANSGFETKQDHGLVTSLYANYNDGRVFANIQHSVFGWDIYPGTNPHQFRKGYQWFCELGAVAGFARATLAYASASGRSLDDGEDGLRHDRFPITHKILEPYEFLLFHTYGGGNGTFEGPPGERHGLMLDAYAFAGRIDLGIAANLNLWASYLWAHRMEPRGTSFGQYTTSGRETSDQERSMFAGLMGRSLSAPPAHCGYVSNGFLGHEFNAGADWKVAEAMTLKLRGAYWKPGAWFGEAVAFKPSAPASAGNDLAAIVGLSCSIMVDF